MEDQEETLDLVHESSKEYLGPLAGSEYQRTLDRLKYESRLQKVLYLRNLGRVERQRLREKYSKSK